MEEAITHHGVWPGGARGAPEVGPSFPPRCIMSLFSDTTNTSEIFAFKILLILTNGGGPKMSRAKIYTCVKFII